MMTQPVTVQPAAYSTVDEYGNSVLGPQGVAVAETGFLDQRGTVEYLNGRDTVVTNWKAFLHPDSVVTALATITFNGQTFQVDGEPYHVFNPRTRMFSHIECTLTVIS